MAEQIRLALVGCGGISAAYIRGYQDLYTRGCRDFTVTACCDTNAAAAEQRAREIGEYQGTQLRVYSDVDYEDWHGHQLDHEYLKLLQEF